MVQTKEKCYIVLCVWGYLACFVNVYVHIIFIAALSYITALQLEIILNFISAVIVRHLPFLYICG